MIARTICVDPWFSWSTCVMEVVRGLFASCMLQCAGQLGALGRGNILENAWNTAELPFVAALVGLAKPRCKHGQFMSWEFLGSRSRLPACCLGLSGLSGLDCLVQWWCVAPW